MRPFFSPPRSLMYLSSSTLVPDLIGDPVKERIQCRCILHSHPRDLIAPPHGACGRGCAPVPRSSWGRGLFERSEFRSPNLSGPGQRHPKGRARAPMVLGPFAETKGSRRAGTKPRKTLPPRRAGTKPRSPPLGVRGRTPAKPSPSSCGAETPQRTPPAYPNKSWSLRLPKCW